MRLMFVIGYTFFAFVGPFFSYSNLYGLEWFVVFRSIDIVMMTLFSAMIKNICWTAMLKTGRLAHRIKMLSVDLLYYWDCLTYPLVVFYKQTVACVFEYWKFAYAFLVILLVSLLRRARLIVSFSLVRAIFFRWQRRNLLRLNGHINVILSLMEK